MNLSIVRRKKKSKKTNEKNGKSIPTKKQRLRIKVSNAGRFTLKVEEVSASKDIETFETEGDTDERPLRSTKKQKRFVERSKTPSKRRSRNKR